MSAESDPPVRRDGKCARRGCRRLRPIAAADEKKRRRLRRYAGNQALSDPFCSTECCRAHHGCELAHLAGMTPEQQQARAEAGRAGMIAGRGGVEYLDPVLA